MELEDDQSPTKNPDLYEYDGVCHVRTLPNHHVAIAGTKLDANGKWVLEEIDAGSRNIVRSWTGDPSKSSSPQNLFSSSDSWCFHIEAQLIRCPLDGAEASKEDSRRAPKEVLEIHNHEQEKVGVACWKGSKQKHIPLAAIQFRPLRCSRPKSRCPNRSLFLNIKPIC